MVNTAYVICRNCRYRVQLPYRVRGEAPLLFRLTCPHCGFTTLYSYADIVEEGVYRSVCMVCGTRLYSFKLGPARCPVCNTRYIVSEGTWAVLEAGVAPPRASEKLAGIGLTLGSQMGASRKEGDIASRIGSIVGGALLGLLAGALIGALLDVMARSEREVVYE